MILYQVEEIPLYSRVFIMNGYWTVTNAFQNFFSSFAYLCGRLHWEILKCLISFRYHLFLVCNSFFTYCWMLFAAVLSNIFASMFIKDIVLFSYNAICFCLYHEWSDTMKTLLTWQWLVTQMGEHTYLWLNGRHRLATPNTALFEDHLGDTDNNRLI